MEHAYSDFVKTIQQSLKDGDIQHALEAFRDGQNATELQNSSWDLIPVVCEYLTWKHEQNNTEAFQCCEQLIDIVAAKSNPEEALLQFIEEIEESTDDTKFLALLKPLQKIILRIPKKRLNSLAWSLNAIQTYLNKCEAPEDVPLDGKEKLLLDSNEDARRIMKLYSAIITFYEEFIQTVNVESEDTHDRSKIICKFLVQLLGKPLVFLDMEAFNGVKSSARIVAENLVSNIFKIIHDPLDLVHMRFRSETNELTKPNTVGISVLFYLIYAENVSVEVVPKVYSPVYLFQNCVHLGTVLLEIDHQMCTEKGLALATAFLRHVKYLKLSYLLLDSGDHSKFCTTLANVIVYNQSESVRKSALDVYRIYLHSFETHGFYLLVYNLASSLHHSGLIGYTVTQYKDYLAQELSTEQISVYFRGPKLLRMLQAFCYLHKNEESDLIELSDQIVATLNLLRYLALRDKENVTEIWDYFEVLDEVYFKPLRKGIDLSRAHYELRAKELKEETATGDGGNTKTDTFVTVGRERLSELPKNEKLRVLYSSLTAFDVMDSLLSRLVECIEANKCCSAKGSHQHDGSYEDDIKNKILSASLPFVPQLGWSKEAISAGAECAGYPAITHGMFGAGDLVHYFQTTSNLQLVERLKQFRNEQAERAIPPGQFAEKAIQERLRLIVPYIGKWPQAIAIMSLPPNVPNALATLLTMVDDICYYAGDRSVDFNWYIRRIGIAAVYKATELYMIQDKSEGFEETWTFLNRRLEEAVQLHDILIKSDVKSQTAKETAQAVFVTARNILGLNWNR